MLCRASLASAQRLWPDSSDGEISKSGCRDKLKTVQGLKPRSKVREMVFDFWTLGFGLWAGMIRGGRFDRLGFVKEEISGSPDSVDGKSIDKQSSAPIERSLVAGRDYYLERGLMVFTAEFLRARGYCCDSGCRHCPYSEGVIK